MYYWNTRSSAWLGRLWWSELNLTHSSLLIFRCVLLFHQIKIKIDSLFIFQSWFRVKVVQTCCYVNSSKESSRSSTVNVNEDKMWSLTAITWLMVSVKGKEFSCMTTAKLECRIKGYLPENIRSRFDDKCSGLIKVSEEKSRVKINCWV